MFQYCGKYPFTESHDRLKKKVAGSTPTKKHINYNSPTQYNIINVKAQVLSERFYGHLIALVFISTEMYYYKTYRKK